MHVVLPTNLQLQAESGVSHKQCTYSIKQQVAFSITAERQESPRCISRVQSMGCFVHMHPLCKILTGGRRGLKRSEGPLYIHSHSGHSIQAGALCGLLELSQDGQHNLIPLDHTCRFEESCKEKGD